MTLIMYKKGFYRIDVNRRAEFFALVESMDEIACRAFLVKYGEKA